MADIEQKVGIVLTARVDKAKVDEAVGAVKQELQKVSSEKPLDGATKSAEQFEFKMRDAKTGVKMLAWEIGGAAGPVGSLAARFLTLENSMKGLAGMGIGLAVTAVAMLIKMFQDLDVFGTKAHESLVKGAEKVNEIYKRTAEEVKNLRNELAGISKEQAEITELNTKEKDLKALLIKLETDHNNQRYGASNIIKNIFSTDKDITEVNKQLAGIEVTRAALNEKILLSKQRQQLADAKDMGPKGLNSEEEDRIREQKRERWKKEQEDARKKANEMGPTAEMFYAEQVREVQAEKRKQDKLKEQERRYQDDKLKYMAKVNGDIARMTEENDERMFRLQAEAYDRQMELQQRTVGVLTEGLTAFFDEGVSGLMRYISNKLRAQAIDALAQGLWETAQAIAAFATYRYHEGAQHMAAAGSFYGFAALYGAGSAFTSAAAGGGGGSRGESSSRTRNEMQRGYEGGGSSSKQQQTVINVNVGGHWIQTSPEADKAIYQSVQNYTNRRYPGATKSRL